MRYSLFGAASADLWSRRRRRRVIDKTRKSRIYSLSGGASRRMALRADETDAWTPQGLTRPRGAWRVAVMTEHKVY